MVATHSSPPILHVISKNYCTGHNLHSVSIRRVYRIWRTSVLLRLFHICLDELCEVYAGQFCIRSQVIFYNCNVKKKQKITLDAKVGCLQGANIQLFDVDIHLNYVQGQIRCWIISLMFTSFHLVFLQY